MPKTDKALETLKAKAVEDMCLMDDVLFHICFNQNRKCTALLLRTILSMKDLSVRSVETQKKTESIIGHSAILDVKAVDKSGNLYDIEIQQEKEKDTRKRARYYSALLDVSTLRKRRKYETLPESYVIFLTKGDHLGFGKSIYIIDRRINGSWKPFSDGTHMVYVDVLNADRNTELGQLMADMLCTDYREMHSKELSRVVRYYKATAEGRKKVMMSKGLEDLAKYCEKKGERRGTIRGEENGRMDVARSLLKDGTPAAKVAELTKLLLQKVENIRI